MVGIGCRFPGGADDADAFWELLVGGKDAVSVVPPDRWNIDAFYDPDPAAPDKIYTRWGGFLEHVDLFDAHFFGISPREALHIDPQQRLLLEVAWEALEDGGQVPEKLAGSNAGVFVGISTHDYSDLQVVDPRGDPGKDPLAGLYGGTGGVLSIAANRISYSLNLRGPSLAVDTACSSALVATHLACQSLWQGECDLALAGGVNCVLSPIITGAFCKAGMLSPDGRSKAFDARANGYVRGEGAGMVVLKPLAQALADGDPIYAVIRGSAVNQDGRTQGLTVPSRDAQEALLRRAYTEAGIRPPQVRYVEAHGTGTAVGDPIEARAIGTVLGKGRRRDSPLVIGSVKTNIGHLEAASGVAGLIKAALMLKHRAVPPSLHFDEPNPRIPFEDLRLRVPRTLEPLPEGAAPAVLGVNSFGFGGTNAHVILEEAPAARTTPTSADRSERGGAHLIPLSARSSEALRATAEKCLEHLSRHPEVRLGDLSHSASLRRSHHDHRLAVVVESREELAAHLQAFISGESRPHMSSGRPSSRQRPKLVFAFAGMGPQWWAMGRELLREEPVFRAAIDRCDALLSKLAPWSLLDELMADEASSRMDRTEVAQPANFALQVALAALWRSYGVEPDAIIGHSAGEMAAAHVAGALSLEDAVTVVYHRSRLQQRAAGKGRMLAAGLTRDEAEGTIEAWADRVSLAAINGSASVTLSGDTDALEEIAGSLNKKQVFCRLLPVNVPYHSRHMDPLKTELLEALEDIQPQPARIRIYSSVTGEPAEGIELDASYWWRNVRQPVQFAGSLGKLIGEGHTFFVELGPHPILARDIVAVLAAHEVKGTVLPALRRDEGERAVTLASLGALYINGFSLDWSKLGEPGATFVRLPGYAWQRERYWHEPEAARQFRLGPRLHPLLGRRQDSAHPTWRAELASKAVAYLEDHTLLDTTLYPATAYLETIFAAARAMSGSDACIVEEAEIKRPLVLVDRTALSLQLVYDPHESLVSLFSRVNGPAATWTLNLTARLRRERGPGECPPLSPEAIIARCSGELSGTECYREFELRGIQYGPRFRGIEKVWTGEGEALARVSMPGVLDSDPDDYLFHPALFDACLQLVHAMIARKDGLYVPVRLERTRFYRHPRTEGLWSHARLLKQSDSAFEVELRIADADGVVADFKGVRLQFLANDAGKLPQDIGECLYEFGWYAKWRPGMRRRQADHLAPASEICRDLRAEAARLGQQLRRRHVSDVVDPELDRLACAYAVQALTALGWTFAPGQRIAAAALSRDLGIAPQYERLCERLLAILEDERIVKRDGPDVHVQKQPEIIDAEAQRRTLLESYPEHAPLLELLGRCGSRLAEVLRGEYPPVELLFPGGAMALAESVYQDSPALLVYNLIARNAVAAALGRLPTDRTVRIIEIGAGTGGTTARLLPELPAHRTEYVYTDVSNTFTGFAQQKFRDYPFVQYRLLDIEADPAGQGFEPNSFDLVVAVDVLHATRDLRQSLENVKRLLVSNGMVLLIEPTRVTRSFDLMFGVLPGWWRFTDHDLRPAHPLLAADRWRTLLADAGFGEPEAITDLSPASDALHTVFLARGPAIEDEVLGHEASLPLPSEPGSWLIYADRGGVGRELASVLDSCGESCIIVSPGAEPCLLAERHHQIRPDSADDVARVLSDVRADWPACRGVVHLWNLDVPAAERSGQDERDEAQLLGTVSVLHLVQALARAEGAAPPGVWLVTRGAQAVAAGEEVALPGAPVWGLGRVVMNEHPALRCTLIDLDPKPGTPAVELLFGELWPRDGEQEIAFRGGERYVNRLVRLSTQASAVAESPQIVEAGDLPYRVEAAKPGVLDSLMLKEIERRPPGPGEVEIQVHAAGLNFRDVIKAMGLYPASTEDERGGWIGDECAGVVVHVGEGVHTFEVGDEVIALAPGAFSAFATVPTIFVVRKPAHLSFEEAATIPVAFLTAHYALNHVGRLSRGERVLIHSAAGGVGLAAVQLCQQAGAEIHATAGSPEKRTFLGSLGIRHVMDDRSLVFADEVMEHTGGSGVDVVLNSLAGEFIPKSLSVLGLGGRFLELGKMDIYGNSRLGLWPFRNGLSFSAIDLARLVRERPALVRQLLDELMQRFEAGELRPLPLKIFPIGEVASAFRYMAQARHTGKIVLSMRSGPAPVATTPRRGPLLKADASYLITGGLGGFGLAVAQWMVDEGARHLVLLGRSGASTPDAREAVQRMTKRGAEVLVEKVDVTCEEEVAGVLTRISRTLPPLRGVIHAAMVLDDGLLVSLNRERFERVMDPKVKGAWHLHALTRDLPLDFFVLFSSFSAIAGVPGQGNYAAANAYLDAFAHYRRARNLPALAINWGAIGEVGYVARHSELYRLFERQGIVPFKAREAVAILHRLMSMPSCQVGVARADIAKLAAFYEQFAPASRMSHLIANQTKAQPEMGSRKRQRGWLRTALLGTPPADREGLLESFLREQMAEVLGTSASRLDFQEPLSNLGIDSLMAVQMETLIEVEAGVSLPTGFLLSPNATMAEVVKAVLAQAALAQAGPASEAAAAR